MGRKFLSVLGTGEYKNCFYSYGEEKVLTNYIQEAIIKIFCKEWNEEDKAIIFLTEKAKKDNWDNKECENRRLKERLNLTGNLKVEAVDIPDGKNEEEIWDIFDCIYESIEEGDEIIFDITHSFRSIPMQVLVVLNYAKVLKNINLKGIYYGAFEAREVVDREEVTPIFDLTSFNELLGWTQGINSFLNYGNSKQLSDLYEDLRKTRAKDGDISYGALRPLIMSLKDFTSTMYTCRGKSNSDNHKSATKKSIGAAYNSLKGNLEKLDEEKEALIRPLKPLFNKVKDKLTSFENMDNFTSGMVSTKWCIENNMIQQAYTALDETLKTYICDLYNLDNSSPEYREHIAKAALNVYRLEECKWKVKDIYIEDIKKILEDLKDNKEIFKIADKLRDRRNDINHYGFSKKAASYEDLYKDIVELYDRFYAFVKEKRGVENE